MIDQKTPGQVESENLLSRVPLADPRADNASLRAQILSAMADALDSGSYILGPQVSAFQSSMAKQLGVAGSVGVASGTDALVLALLAVGVGSGDEVITVSHTAGPTVAAIRMIGAIPVLIDIDPSTYCLDPALLEAAIGPLTRAVIAVHLYGHPADLDRISEVCLQHGVPLVEDCAQAQGASIGGRQVGSIGAAGCFSFYPTKNLGAIGDGGMVAGGQIIVERLRQLRTYGWTRPQFSELTAGRCSRLDELQAAILNVKLGHLFETIEKRRALAKQYNDELADLPLSLPIEQSGCRHVYHLYVVRCKQRNLLAQYLDRLGIATGIHYPFAVHSQPGIASAARIPGPLTETERAVGEILTLPLYPSMTRDDQTRVVVGIRSFFGGR